MRSFVLAALLCLGLRAADPTYCVPTKVHADLGLSLNLGNSVFFEEDGSIIAADTRNNQVFRVSGSGAKTVIAGTGERGYSGDGGPATAATLKNPESVYVSGTGEIFIADSDNGRIRKIDKTGIITTIAGGSGRGFEHSRPEPMDPLQVLFQRPRQIQMDRKGNLYFLAEQDFRRTQVHVLDSETRLLRLVEPSLLNANRPFFPYAFAIDPQDRVVIGGRQVSDTDPDGSMYKLKYVGADRDRKTLQGVLSAVTSIAYDVAGNLYLAEPGRLLKLTPGDELYTLAGGVTGEYIPRDRVADLTTSFTFSVAVRGTSVYVVGRDVRRIDSGTCSVPVRPMIAQSGHGVGNAGFSSVGRPTSSLRIAPGELITIYGAGFGPEPGQQAETQGGALPADIGGTKVLFDGKPLPLLFAGPNQVNAILPFQIAVEVGCLTVVVRGNASDAHCVRVFRTDPGLFSHAGSNEAIALNQDGSVNSRTNPAVAGSVVQLWGTGFGTMSPLPIDGTITGGVLSRVDADVAITINGLSAPLLYVGSAPGMAAGVVQLNVRIPEISRDAPSIAALFITAGGVYHNGAIWVR
jgi:uncharacterized protein (TIGR03437 family)